MSLDWMKGSEAAPQKSGLRVHPCGAGHRLLVTFLGGTESIAAIKVHWIRDGDKGTSFPCFGPSCKFCPGPTTPKWFAPVLLGVAYLPPASSTFDPTRGEYRYDVTKWKRGVLEILPGWSEIVEAVTPNVVAHIVRQLKPRNQPARWEIVGTMTGVPTGLLFDPCPVVENMWGLNPFVRRHE